MKPAARPGSRRGRDARAPRGPGTFGALVCLLTACGDPEPLEGRAWVIHPEGWADDHGRALRAAGYPFEECASCHDQPSTPGDCGACHEQGVTDCATCHAELTEPHPAHERFDCATCHPVPRDLRTPGHLEDGPDDVRLVGLAAARDHSPSYGAGGGCADTACHAGPGAARPRPTWTPSADLGCGDCHGDPPLGHPVDRCDRCHAEPGVGATHVDGRVDAVDWRALPCDGCHGGGGQPAPPRDLAGNSDRSARGVGAHAAHLEPDQAAPVACGACHRVPATVDAPGHLDPEPGAEVMLERGAYAAGGCADTVCHGADRPAWTGDAPCGTCHGLPPAEHPRGDCARCHLTAGPELTIAEPGAHVDGRSDLEGLGADACARCHEDATRAPPGGSHAAHDQPCATCHPTPDRALAPGHLDGVVQVALVAGRFDGRGCAEVWCHGGGAPVWGAPETGSGCGACHGDPPAGHAAGECTLCHPGADDPRHLNRRIDVTAPRGCGDCHGDPPASGAHDAHIRPSAARPVSCESCHLRPAYLEAPGHLDPPPVEVELEVGRYDAGGCAETACHAGPGAATPTPGWDAGPEAVACGGCHGVPPPGHPEGDCALCHGSVVDRALRIVAPDRHVNGEVDFR